MALAGRQQVWLGPAFGGRTVTARADDRSAHILVDGHHVKTVVSRLDASHLQELRMRGARPAGPPPAAAALPARDGRTLLPAGTAIGTDRTVQRDGVVALAGKTFTVHPGLAGQRATLRLDDHLMHAIAGGQVVGTWPLPVPAGQRAALRGARPASGQAPAAAAPSTALQARRRVPADGIIMVARQRLRVGRAHAGKTVTVIAEDTHFRILDGDHELALHPRTTSHPVTRFKAHATPRGKGSCQRCPEHELSRKSRDLTPTPGGDGDQVAADDGGCPEQVVGDGGDDPARRGTAHSGQCGLSLVPHPADDEPGGDVRGLLLGGEGRVPGLGDLGVGGPAAQLVVPATFSGALTHYERPHVATHSRGVISARPTAA